jgi:hypothetical protein
MGSSVFWPIIGTEDKLTTAQRLLLISVLAAPVMTADTKVKMENLPPAVREAVQSHKTAL